MYLCSHHTPLVGLQHPLKMKEGSGRFLQQETPYKKMQVSISSASQGLHGNHSPCPACSLGSGFCTAELQGFATLMPLRTEEGHVKRMQEEDALCAHSVHILSACLQAGMPQQLREARVFCVKDLA